MLAIALAACGTSGSGTAKVGESAPRVSVVIKLDVRPGAVDALAHKVEAVESRLS